jgi:hypothetical protein
MPPVMTLNSSILDPHYSIFRDVIAPTLRTKLGGGASSARRLYERPVYQFRLQATHESQPQAEAIYGFYLYHQGDTPFWFDGNQWGTISTPLLVGFGTATQTHYFLPNRHITGSLLVSVTAAPAYDTPVLTAVTATGSSGLIVFAAPPAADAKITATYTCRYKVIFFHEGEVLLSEEQFYNQLYRYQGLVLREVVP